VAKGSLITLKFHTYHDAGTGTQVTRLTPPDVLCHRNYFYQKCFAQSGDKLLFAGEFDGNRNYYLMDLATQQATQLTEGSGDNTFGGFLSQDDRYLYYVKNERYLQRVDLSSLNEETVYEVPEQWVGYGTWVANSECTSLVGIEIDRNDWMPLTDWKVFHTFFTHKPHCRLVRIDLNSGQSHVIHENNLWLGHPIYRPYHDDTVAFCHEGPHDLVDARMWLINEDGTNVRKVKEHAEGESCTHEFWVPDGSALIYVSYLKNHSERQIWRYDPESNRNDVVMTMPACSHLMSNETGTLLVGDGAGTPVDVQDASGYTIENDPWLYVFNVDKKQYVRVAAHNSSWQVLDGDRQVTHPHPSFTPDDKKILFSSDFEGKPAIYLAALPDALFNQ
jgi:oligogalacturonide lyase